MKTFHLWLFLSSTWNLRALKYPFISPAPWADTSLNNLLTRRHFSLPPKSLRLASRRRKKKMNAKWKVWDKSYCRRYKKNVPPSLRFLCAINFLMRILKHLVSAFEETISAEIRNVGFGPYVRSWLNLSCLVNESHSRFCLPISITNVGK